MEDYDWWLVLAFFGLGILVGLPVWGWDNNDAEQLGQSICDQEYDMDYKSYYNKELKCKPKVIKEEVEYDGIVIQIGE